MIAHLAAAGLAGLLLLGTGLWHPIRDARVAARKKLRRKRRR